MKSSVPINPPVRCRRQLDMELGADLRTDSHSERSSTALVSLSAHFEIHFMEVYTW